MGAKLNPAQREQLQEKALEMARERPHASFASISTALGLNRARVWDWYNTNSNGFKDKYKEVLNEAFSALEGPAISALGELVEEKNFQAVKYVLDGTGHKPADKIEQVNETTIVVSIEEEEQNG